jgi:hypothetical protein
VGLKTPTTFKTAIADHFDETSTWLPSVVDGWLREAQYTITSKYRRWRFLRKTWTFNTVASTATYDYDTIDGGDENLLHVESMTVAGERDLVWVGANEADRLFVARNIGEGEPRYWTDWGKSDGTDSVVTLFPTPSGIETITVRGYRKPADFITADTVTDLPDEFDQVIVNYCVGRAYLHQEVPFMYEHYMALALTKLEELRDYYEAIPMDHPAILAGGANRYRGERFGPVYFPFEV